MVQQQVRRRPKLFWVTEEPTTRALRRGAYHTVPFDDIRGAAHYANQLQPWDRTLERLLPLDTWFPLGGRVAVLGARLHTVDDVALVTRCVLDPAYRRGCDLLLWADRESNRVDADLVDPAYRYPWTLDRFRYLIDRYEARHVDDALPPLTPIEHMLLTALGARQLRPRVQYGVDLFRLDFAFPERRLAVEADGREWHDKARDAARDAVLASRGWNVMHFSGSDIYRDAEACAAAVEARYNDVARVLDYTEPLPRRRGWWQRLLDLLRRSRSIAHEDGGTYTVDQGIVASSSRLDHDQREAVASSDGVTQVIAPAGSGKTTVLVQRVVELLARGVPAHRILCTTFNRAARDQLRDRLLQAGVPGEVDVHTFHSTGRLVLATDGLLPRNMVEFSWGEWRKLGGLVSREPGSEFLDAADAADWVSPFQVGRSRDTG